MKPILFSTPMVQAILAGRKTQTRRVINPQPVGGVRFCNIVDAAHPRGGWQDFHGRFLPRQLHIGDVLYVRETWRLQNYDYHSDTRTYDGQKLQFRADFTDEANALYGRRGGVAPCKWRPSIHMPKEAARIFLRVTDVRAERLHDIREAGAKAEGIVFTDFGLYQPRGKISFDGGITFYTFLPEQNPGFHFGRVDGPKECRETARAAFAGLWESINAKRGYGWDTNPWVFVYEFEQITKEEAEK